MNRQSRNLKPQKELQNNDRKARLFLGMAYLMNGNTDNAITEWSSYLDTFPADNLSGVLLKSISLLTSSEISSETADLMTNSIEALIAQEDKVLDAAPYFRGDRSFRYGHGFFHHGFLRCD